MVLKKTGFNGILGEYEFDPSWIDFQTQDYHDYRKQYEYYQKYKPTRFPDNSTPLNVEVESTYHCNLKCPFCARVVEGNSKVNQHMDRNVWETFCSQIKGSTTKSLMMDHEGESLLNPRLPDMISEARSAGVVDIWLHTNANLLTKRKSEELIESGLTKLNVSIDATTEQTYSKVRPGGNFARVEENLLNFIDLKRRLDRRDIRVRASFVYNEQNKNERSSFIQRWKDHVNLVAIQSMIDMSSFADPASFLSQRPDKHGDAKILNSFTCSHLWSTPILDTNGNIAACGMPIRTSTTNDLIIGNILEERLSDLWNSDKIIKLRESHKSSTISCETCQACALSLASASNAQEGFD